MHPPRGYLRILQGDRGKGLILSDFIQLTGIDWSISRKEPIKKKKKEKTTPKGSLFIF